jgi:hypothetical protein
MRQRSATKRVTQLLAKGVPFANTPAFDEWKRECLRLGERAEKSLLNVLRSKAAGESEKYGAVLALRLMGYEAHGKGYGDDLTYIVRDRHGRVLLGPRQKPAGKFVKRKAAQKARTASPSKSASVR